MIERREVCEGVFCRSRVFFGRGWGDNGMWEGVIGNVWVGVRAIFG